MIKLISNGPFSDKHVGGGIELADSVTPLVIGRSIPAGSIMVAAGRGRPGWASGINIAGDTDGSTWNTAFSAETMGVFHATAARDIIADSVNFGWVGSSSDFNSVLYSLLLDPSYDTIQATANNSGVVDLLGTNPVGTCDITTTGPAVLIAFLFDSSANVPAGWTDLFPVPGDITGQFWCRAIYRMVPAAGTYTLNYPGLAGAWSIAMLAIGQSVPVLGDYSRYIVDAPVLKDKENYPSLLDFSLAPTDGAFVKPTRGTYIVVDTKTYPKWFTGYITNDPELTYLGTRNNVPTWGYVYEATDDSYLLNLKPIGVIPPLVNTTSGKILKTILKVLDPTGVFDVSGIQDGIMFARYNADPNLHFGDVIKQLADASAFRYRVHDRAIVFEPKDTTPATLTIDGNSKHFSPSRLTLKPTQDQIVNDAIVVGNVEPQNYISEYMVGDGETGSFPLLSGVFGVDSVVLLDETFPNTDIDPQVWAEFDEVDDFLQVSNGYLNSLGGNGAGALDVYLQTQKVLPLEGQLRLTHGEYDFLDSASAGVNGVVSSMWTQAPNMGLTGCVFGIRVNKSGAVTTLNPITNGAVDGSQSLVIDYTKRYIIRTLCSFKRSFRQETAYGYLDGVGATGTYGGGSVADTVTYSTWIVEIDPTDGTEVSAVQWTNADVAMSADTVYAFYIPVASNDLHCTVSNITLSTPMQASLQMKLRGTSDYVRKLIGPNEIDSLDALAPIATIATDGSGLASQNNTTLGVPKYNPGNAALTFFKNSTAQVSYQPQPGDLVHVSYRRAALSAGHVQDPASVSSEATAWGDNGIRSLTKTDIVPPPRTSSECEAAAAAIIKGLGIQHYEGTYVQNHLYEFTGHPFSGTVLKFTNLPASFPSYIDSEVVTEVKTTLKGTPSFEVFEHEVTFGKSDYLGKFVARFTGKTTDEILGAIDASVSPSFAQLSAIGTTFIGDVVAPTLVSWEPTLLHCDAGQAPPVGGGFEVRYTDSGWSQTNDGKNLVVRSATRTFDVPRTNRGKICFIKAYDATGVYSRYASGLRVNFPFVPLPPKGVTFDVTDPTKVKVTVLLPDSQTAWKDIYGLLIQDQETTFGTPGTLTLVSSGADIRDVTVIGRVAESLVAETVRLNSGTGVTTTNSFSSIQRVLLNETSATNTVTVKLGADVVATVAPEQFYVDTVQLVYKVEDIALAAYPDNPELQFTYDNASLAAHKTFRLSFYNLLGEYSPTVTADIDTGASTSANTECLDVRAFGAVGNGVAVDTTQVQAALDKAEQNVAANSTIASGGNPGPENVLGRPTVDLNGWGSNGHVGAYELGQDQGYNWGTDGGTTLPYTNAGNAVDGSDSTKATAVGSHTHAYYGCVYAFPTLAGAKHLNIHSEVPANGQDGLSITKRSAGIWYTLDNGKNWIQVYNQGTRAKQWDTFALPVGFDTANLKVLVFTDSHDDMAHYVFDINASGITPALVVPTGGPTKVCVPSGVTCLVGDLRIASGVSIQIDGTLRSAVGGTQILHCDSGSTDITISGSGTIDGNQFSGGFGTDSPLVNLPCDNVRIDGNLQVTNWHSLAFQITPSVNNLRTLVSAVNLKDVYQFLHFTGTKVAGSPDTIQNATLSKGLTVTNCTADGAGPGIIVSHADGVLIDNCKLESPGGYAGAIFHGGILLTGVKNAIVDGCRVTGFLATSAVCPEKGFGIEVVGVGDESTQVRILNNTVLNNGEGITLRDLTANWQGIEIAFNTVKDNPCSDIYVPIVAGAQVYIHNNTADSIQPSSAAIATAAGGGTDVSGYSLVNPQTTGTEVTYGGTQVGPISFAGDLSGTISSQTVIGLRGKQLDATTVGTPSDGQLITYEASSGKYKAKDLVIPNGSVTEASISLSDVTTDDVSITKHGFAPKAPNDALKFLNGVGGYSKPSLTGEVNIQSGTSYTIQSSDKGKLVVLTNAASVAVTLDSSLAVNFICGILFTGAAGGTATPSSGTLNGAASGTFSQGGGALVFWPGTNWWDLSGSGGGGGSVTFAGDLSGTGLTQEVVGILNKAINGTVPTDGQILQYSSSSGKWEMVVDRPIFPVSGIGGKPAAGQLVGIYTAAASFIFPANFASPNSYGSCGTNPTATATYSIYKNGSLIGNVAVSTSGVFTFTTVGGTSVTFNAGDRLTIVAPGSQDATMADVGMTLVGTRSATVPATAVPPIFAWKGTYAGGTTYHPFDVVAYTVSGKVQSYVCILTTTGNNPTNTTYWSLLAQAGGDGSTTAAQIQTEAFIYAVDAGTTNAFSVTLSPAPNVVDGSVVVFRAANAVTGASTLTLPGDTGATGGTAKSIVKQGGTALALSDIAADQVVIAVWDNAHTKWKVVGGGGGNTTAKYIIGATDASLTNAAVWPALYNHVDVPPAVRNAMDDEFDGASLNSPNNIWTWFNQGSATETQQNGCAVISCVSNGGSDSARFIGQTLPTAPYTFIAKLAFHEPLAWGQNYMFPGMFLWETATSKYLSWGFQVNGGWGLRLRGNNVEPFDFSMSPMPWSYFGINRTSTTLSFLFSPDGIVWDTIVTRTITQDFTTAPDTIGIGVNPFAQKSVIVCDFFRRTL
jgi:Right handed beta helix region